MCGVSSPAAPNSRERVRNALRAAGLDCAIVETPTRRARPSRPQRRWAPASGRSSSRSSSCATTSPCWRWWPATTAWTRRDWRQLAGGRITRADAARVREHTGFAIGGVAPLGSREPLPVFCDADLLRHDYVWAAAGAPDAVFRVEPRALAEAAGAQVAELALRDG